MRARSLERSFHKVYRERLDALDLGQVKVE